MSERADTPTPPTPPKRMLTPAERRAPYAAFAASYQARKATLMAKYPHKTERECGKRALEDTDIEFWGVSYVVES